MIKIAWYGDDFTGAAAVMEVLSFAGIPAILFLDTPTNEQLERFPNLQAVGIASTARAQSPEWMRDHLPIAFEQLLSLKPELLHYKICSTLDSSPDSGSIGCAIEIGSETTSSRAVPVLVAAPKMRRFQLFGHLFAGYGEDVFRLDRHPVMSSHPTTPMHESDVAAHIAKQSDDIVTNNISIETLRATNGDLKFGGHSGGEKICVTTIDSIDASTDTLAGRSIWQNRKTSPFVVGSQGVEYALVEYWRENGEIENSTVTKGIGKADQMVCVSGSVSPITAQQIEWASENGFRCIKLKASVVCSSKEAIQNESKRVVNEALSALSEGKDPLIFTARGGDDPAVFEFRAAVEGSTMSMQEANAQVGSILGAILKEVLEISGVRRAVVSGGDTSGFATMQLGAYALSAIAPTIPGASILKVHADGFADGLELALKGGQMGTTDYYGWIKEGGGTR